ncbi:MAG: DUF2437 domain-containing protein, partial [Anaerolineae bacterium]|nr:DUF2437 domain-containing protein [Anaerolineae bacterium]
MEIIGEMTARIVRFSRGSQTIYGFLKGDSVFELIGDVHGEFEQGSYIARLNELRLLAPCEPTKIVGVGWNYRYHIEEVAADIPDVPILFLKPPSSVVGPAD